jgi:hypothetical protein
MAAERHARTTVEPCSRTPPDPASICSYSVDDQSSALCRSNRPQVSILSRAFTSFFINNTNGAYGSFHDSAASHIWPLHQKVLNLHICACERCCSVEMGMSGHAPGAAVSAVSIATTVVAALAVLTRLCTRTFIVKNAGVDDGFITFALVSLVLRDTRHSAVR